MIRLSCVLSNGDYNRLQRGYLINTCIHSFRRQRNWLSHLSNNFSTAVFILKITIHFHPLGDNTFFQKSLPFRYRNWNILMSPPINIGNCPFLWKDPIMIIAQKSQYFVCELSSIHFQSFNIPNNVRYILGEKEGSIDSNHTKNWAKRISYWDFVRTNQMDYW